MAGHSKWANTKHRKNAQDIKKSKIFTKIIKDITISSSKHGSDINKNFQLRSLLEKARLYNVGKDIIQKAIQRSKQNNKKDSLCNMKYAGYGPAGIAIIVHCNTDNGNRTVSKIRNIFSKFKGCLIKYNSIKYLFDFLFTIKINMEMYNKKNVIDLVDKNDMILYRKKTKKYLILQIKKNNFKKIKKYFSIFSITFHAIQIEIKPKIIYDINNINREKILIIINLLKKLKETVEVVHNAKI